MEGQVDMNIHRGKENAGKTRIGFHNVINDTCNEQHTEDYMVTDTEGQADINIHRGRLERWRNMS